MAYLTDWAGDMFQLRATESPAGSADEVLFSGLAQLARTVGNLETTILNLEHEVRGLSTSIAALQ